MSTAPVVEAGERSSYLDEFCRSLNGDLELFRYAIEDLEERYGETYSSDATFILSNLASFAAHHNHSLSQVLRTYADFTAQVLEDYKIFARTGRYQYHSEEQIERIVSDKAFQLDYLYILTLSTPLNRSRYEVFLNFRNAVRKYLRRESLCLEIGGGNCFDSVFLSNYGRVDVFERNEKSLLWRDILGIGNNINLKIEYYQFDDVGKYDFVSMIELLEHVSTPAEYLLGAHDVLKADGCAYFTFAIRMPQIDHLYQFDSIEQCQNLLSDTGFTIVEDYCTINTHRHFEEEERWALAANPKFAVTYCAFVRKQPGHQVPNLIGEFNDDI
jgi:SAM-dependent methyltransferase